MGARGCHRGSTAGVPRHKVDGFSWGQLGDHPQLAFADNFVPFTAGGPLVDDYDHATVLQVFHDFVYGVKIRHLVPHIAQ